MKAAELLSRPDFESENRAAEATCSVSELNRRARLLLEGSIGPVRVRGEISGFTRAASGHIYFSLKDAGAQVRCALWRSKAAALAFEPRNGDAVEVRATVTLFEARGEYQLGIESMRRAGAGALYEQFLRLKEKLSAQGLFDAGRKRPLPALPRGIGIVTSPQAAALRDVLTTLARRAPMIPVVLYPAPVQGEGAAAAIARAVDVAGARAAQDGVEVLILCRGGGSIEDLWSFNEEVVARAIVACPIPVVSGVGHETDFTIADWVADLRAPTPTGAAELVSQAIDDLFALLATRARAMSRTLHDKLQSAQQRLDWLARGLAPPSARLAMRRQALAHAADRLGRAAHACTSDSRGRFASIAGRLRAPVIAPLQLSVRHLAGRLALASENRFTERVAQLERLSAGLEMLNPARVLERGYAIVRDSAGKLVRDSAATAAGDSLSLRFARGQAIVTVTRSDS